MLSQPYSYRDLRAGALAGYAASGKWGSFRRNCASTRVKGF